MRVINIVLLLSAHFALYTHALPTPSSLSTRQEGGLRTHPPYDYTLHRRAMLAKEPIPALEEGQVYQKDVHQQLASAKANNAGQEFRGGLTGAGRSVTYGASQGYLHSKAAYQSFRSGQFRQGFTHTGKAIVKPIAGVGLSTVPLYNGIKYGMKSTGGAISQKYQQYRTPRYQAASGMNANDLKNQVYMTKNQTPGKDYSQATVRENLRFKTQNYANPTPNKVVPVTTMNPTPFIPNSQQQRNKDLPWSSTSGSPQYSSVQAQHLGGVAPVTGGQSQYHRGGDLPWTATINNQRVESQLQ